jgi:hypothetical protein
LGFFFIAITAAPDETDGRTTLEMVVSMELGFFDSVGGKVLTLGKIFVGGIWTGGVVGGDIVLIIFFITLAGDAREATRLSPFNAL